MASLRVLALLLFAVLTHQVYAYTTTFCNPAEPPYGNGYFAHLSSASDSRYDFACSPPPAFSRVPPSASFTRSNARPAGC